MQLLLLKLKREHTPSAIETGDFLKSFHSAQYSRAVISIYRCTAESPSEHHSQSQLDVSWDVLLAIDDTERCRINARVGDTELHSIESIECFRAELQSEPFRNLRVFEHRDIEIIDARRSKIGHDTGSVTESERRIE